MKNENKKLSRKRKRRTGRKLKTNDKMKLLLKKLYVKRKRKILRKLKN